MEKYLDELHKEILDEEQLIGNTLMKGLFFVQEMHDPGTWSDTALSFPVHVSYFATDRVLKHYQVDPQLSSTLSSEPS